MTWLELWRRYYMAVCERPFPDEDIHDMRRRRRRVAEMMADPKETAPAS